jgi:hypothetical protein
MPVPFKKRKVAIYANYLGIFPIKEKAKEGKDLKDTTTAPLYAPLGIIPCNDDVSWIVVDV